MIPYVRSRPIRRKVALLIAVAMVVGLLLSAGAVVVYELTTSRPRAVNDARSQADLIRVNSTAALQFNDRAAAAENLATLRSRPEILAASLFRPDGSLQARYATPGAPPPPSELVAGITYHPGRLVLIEPVEVDSHLVGWISLQYRMPTLRQRLPAYGLVAAVVLLALGTAGVLLLGMLGRSVSLPLLTLTRAARAITETGDFRLRVPDRSGDEIGLLTEAFNRMVATVETQQGALQQSEARLRLALEAARMETWVVDLAGGREAALDELLRRVHPDDRAEAEARIRAAMDAGAAFEVEFRAAGADAAERWTALRGQVFTGDPGGERLIGVAQDVTEQRRIGQQLVQSQRMEAIGNLAGGIAHDFNNLLTGMIGYLSFVQRRLPADPALRDDVAQVDRAARRAAALTSQLLSYARRQMVMPTVVDLNATVAALEPMIRRVVGEDVLVTIELDRALGVTRVDPGQLEQVLLNLVANARDAMPTGGALRIRTRNLALTPEAARQIPETRAGEYVAIEVTDEGVGMTPEVRARIFEPFFTTKPPGAGTGLGLAMCYGIVKQADGHIEVESEPMRGTRVTVMLPREPVRQGGEGGDAGALGAPRGRETILLVEDDATVRELTARMLREVGYTVLETESAAGARDCMQRLEGRVDLLLTDVVMPGGNGRELADALTALYPGLAVLYMSGYTADVVLRQGLVQEAVAFLTKPFTQSSLAEAVRRVLDARAAR